MVSNEAWVFDELSAQGLQPGLPGVRLAEQVPVFQESDPQAQSVPAQEVQVLLPAALQEILRRLFDPVQFRVLRRRKEQNRKAGPARGAVHG